MQAARTLRLYAAASARVALRARGVRRAETPSGRLIFVVGAPRSGTTFLGSSLGAQPGVVDLGEVQPLKAAIPRLVQLPSAEAAAAIRRIVERVRALAGVRRVRGVEQTPETSFLVPALLEAYPEAKVVHIVRDGRDVAASLLERGWLSAARAGRDDARAVYGAHARFWVEPERAAEFVQASDATRAAWAWRRYAEAARAPEADRRTEIRYEELVTSPAEVSARLAATLELEPAPLARAFSLAHARSVGNFRRLSADELADVEREAGPLLRELGYG